MFGSEEELEDAYKHQELSDAYKRLKAKYSEEEMDDAYKRLKARSDEIRRRAMNDPREWPPKDALIKEWVHKGLKCAICHGNLSLCGYAHVPENHPDAGKQCEDVDVNVHGGLTFRCKALDGGAWFGFDTNHCGDWMGVTLPNGEGFEEPGRIWTAEDVEKETTQLADQFADRFDRFAFLDPPKPKPTPELGDRKLDPEEN